MTRRRRGHLGSCWGYPISRRRGGAKPTARQIVSPALSSCESFSTWSAWLTRRQARDAASSSRPDYPRAAPTQQPGHMRCIRRTVSFPCVPDARTCLLFRPSPLLTLQPSLPQNRHVKNSTSPTSERLLPFLYLSLLVPVAQLEARRPLGPHARNLHLQEKRRRQRRRSWRAGLTADWLALVQVSAGVGSNF